MTVETERHKLQEILARVPDKAVRDDLLADFDAAVSSLQPTDPISDPATVTKVDSIRRLAKAACPRKAPVPSGYMPYGLFVLAGGVIVGCFLLVFLYFAFLPRDEYSSLEGTRPLLVMTLIVSMLFFGGALLFKALYGAAEDTTGEVLQTRFRLAREVFLVFSGIFGTIIGFYFGAADENSQSSPSLTVSWASGRATAAVADGVGPFRAFLVTPDGQRGGAFTGSGRNLTFVTGADCPAGASVELFDARGGTATAPLDCGADPAAENAVAEAMPDAANAETAAPDVSNGF